jgi:alpha-glucosidase (family GH31 glycosyl hydrolase)
VRSPRSVELPPSLRARHPTAHAPRHRLLGVPHVLVTCAAMRIRAVLVLSSVLGVTGVLGVQACSTDQGAPPPAPGEPDASICTLTDVAEPALTSPPRHTPRWAFEPWISKDISSTDDTYAFVGGFEDRNIPVGAVVLDSPWETNYNTFAPNPVRYHDFAALVSDMHARGVKVVVWTTQMVNTTSFDAEPGGDVYDGGAPSFDEAAACGFFVNDATTYFWWKGRGAGIDFTNPRALAWWHGRQDALLDTGIDGYKLDFGENYVTTDPVTTAAGAISHQAYSEAYYRDFLAYGARKRGRDFTTMVRGWDESYAFKGRYYARKEDAPVVWAGDNRRDWIGLADALDTIFRSATAGYVMVGSDLGGYLGFDDKDVTVKVPLRSEVFVRWTAAAALTPFMQLHGQANASPWTLPERPDDVVKVYRYWATLHHELAPFFYSLAEEAYAGAPGIVRPVGDPASWAADFRFTLGEAFLVAPVLADGGTRDVALPAGARWYDWWNDAGAPQDGGTVLKAYDATDWKRIPLFVREGAIVPMAVESDVTGIGAGPEAGGRTVLVYPSRTPTHFALHDDDDTLTQIDVAPAGTGARVDLSRVRVATHLRVRSEAAPASVTLGGAALPVQATRAALEAATSGWFFDAAAHSVWVKVPASTAPSSIVVG